MPKRPKGAALTPEQDRFVGEYLVDLNATRAYRAAYPGTSYRAARAAASRLVANVNIRTEISARRAALSRRARVSADAVVREISFAAFSDPLYLFADEGVTPRPVRQIPLETRKALASVKVRQEKTRRVGDGPDAVEVTATVTEFKFWSKTDALEKLCRHLGLVQEITPLDALLASMPPALAAAVREAMTGAGPSSRTAEPSVN